MGKVWKNSFSIVAGNFLNKAISVAILAVLTGYLGPADFGRYSFVVAYTAFFGVFTDLGLNTIVTRDISSGALNPSRGFGHAVVLRFISTIFTALVLVSSLVLFGYPIEVVRLASAYILSLLLSFRGLFFRNVFDIPFQLHLKMGYPALINVLNEVVTLGVLVLLVALDASLFQLLLGISLSNLPGFVMAAYFSTRLIRPSLRIDPKAWGRVLRESLPLGAQTFLEGVFIITPVFLLSRLSTEEALGFYWLPFRLASSLWIIPGAVMLSLLPIMSQGGGRVREGFTRGLKAAIATGFPIAVIISLYSPEIITLLSGETYTESAPVLSILIWGTLFLFVNTVFSYTFTASGRQLLNIVTAGSVFGSSLLLSLFFIPLGGHLGAAEAVSAALGIGLFVNLFLARRVFDVSLVPVLTRLRLGLFVLAAALFALHSL